MVSIYILKLYGNNSNGGSLYKSDIIVEFNILFSLKSGVLILIEYKLDSEEFNGLKLLFIFFIIIYDIYIYIIIF